jgi:sulfite reductase (NADPH) flavoprotein alpha-component
MTFSFAGPHLLLTQDRFRLLSELTAGMDGPTLMWLSGYLAGLGQQGVPAANVAGPATEAEAALLVTVLYGSQTGHARHIATELAEHLRARGVNARLLGADTYPKRALKEERCLFVVVSTQGDGDPPDHARDLLEYLNGFRAPRLESLNYAVLALGDSSYPQFCLIGRQVDARLESLGGRRLLPLATADVDVETVSEPWVAEVLEQAASLGGRRDAAASNLVSVPIPNAESQAEAVTRARPYRAEVLVNQRITGRGSERDVRHIELRVEGSGIRYMPGDALGVWPVQADALVDEVLDTLHLSGEETIEYRGQSLSLRCWLKEKRELTVLTRPFLAAHADRSDAAELRDVLDPERRDTLAGMLQTWQLADLLARHPAAWTAADLVAALRPLTPRMYSIASSPRPTEGEEVHLTVAHVDYRHDGVHRWGVASRHLADCAEGDGIDIFVEPNERFRLPAEPDRDVVMIGPGTGVAPFRAFVQERAATGTGGRNWLFFGNRYFRSEFLYQTEWQAALADRHLHRLDLAFSRDGSERVYVQHRMQEQAADLYAWLQDGAHLYVCGDASQMAPDVHDALRRIGMQQGGLSEEGASAWLGQMAHEGRYVRDIY